MFVKFFTGSWWWDWEASQFWDEKVTCYKFTKHGSIHTSNTRLNLFMRSWFYNTTAVRGALWWLRQSQRKLRKSSTFAIRQAAARLSPSGSTTFQTPFSPVSFGKSFMKIRSAVPENGCLIFLRTEKKQKKQKNKKTPVKHIRYHLIDGCVNNQPHHWTVFWTSNEDQPFCAGIKLLIS